MTKNKGFTLVELLVVISIIGIIMALSIFGLQGARESSRDGRRKADLEQIRSAIEIYKSDCNKYPLAVQDNLKGDGSVASCSVGNVYISALPDDPSAPEGIYRYYSADGITYEICAYLEQGTGSPVSCGSQTSCGLGRCNYKVTNP